MQKAYVVPIRLVNLPIMLECVFPQGVVRFQRMMNFPITWDTVGEPRAMYTESGITLYNEGEVEEFFYGQLYAYKQIPILLKWLQQFKLENPLASAVKEA